MALARPLADFSLIIDADDEMAVPPGFELPDPHEHAYTIHIHGVTHHGIVPNDALRAALLGMDVLAYPSIFEETSCLSVIEAMAAGCRVICPDLGALPETTAGFARLYPFMPDQAAHAGHFATILEDELRRPWMGQPERARHQQAFCRLTYD